MTGTNNSIPHESGGRFLDICGEFTLAAELDGATLASLEHVTIKPYASFHTMWETYDELLRLAEEGDDDGTTPKPYVEYGVMGKSSLGYDMPYLIVARDSAAVEKWLDLSERAEETGTAEGAGGDLAGVCRGAMMRSLQPIPLRLLAEDAVVRVPDGDGGYAEGVAVSRVRFARTQSVVDDGHRGADAGAGKVYVDALNSDGAFEVPAGSRIDVGGHSYLVAECRRCEDFNGHVHHWELVVR